MKTSIFALVAMLLLCGVAFAKSEAQLAADARRLRALQSQFSALMKVKIDPFSWEAKEFESLGHLPVHTWACRLDAGPDTPQCPPGFRSGRP